ncbi:MAG: histidine phosphatase family protein [Lachnospiraceae bacterium]|nr:histidine phosphatase family protein [Lachnospiraceae bacterium]
MKLVFVRHGDPNYAIDGLTEAGQQEAALLAPRIAAMDVKEFYVSPLGRAKKTAAPGLALAGREAVECEWLREFYCGPIARPDNPASNCCWDWLPADYYADSRLLDVNHWFENEVMQKAHVKEEYDRVTGEFDKLLAAHGYVREEYIYRPVKPNEDTLVFISHFGVSSVLISHLLNCSPMLIWQGMVAPPASITTLATEERRPGIASFRINAFGDTAHLYAAGVAPAFAARFCETYGNGDRED